MRIAVVGLGIGGGAAALALALGPLRDLVLPVMTAVPPIRALMERVLAGRG